MTIFNNQIIRIFKNWILLLIEVFHTKITVVAIINLSLQLPATGWQIFTSELDRPWILHHLIR